MGLNVDRKWVDSGENMIPWVVIERDPRDFGAYLDILYSEDNITR